MVQTQGRLSRASRAFSDLVPAYLREAMVRNRCVRLDLE
jgi:hypothetical protein